MSRALLVDPCREVALCLIDQIGVGWSVIHVHGDCDIILVFLACGKLTDLLEAGFKCLAGCHTTVYRDGTAVSHSTAARRCEINLGDCAGALAEEARVLIVVRIVLRVQHLDETFDLCFIGIIVLIESFYVANDLCHLLNRIAAAVRSAAVAGDTVHIDANLHASSVSSVDAAVCRLCGDDKFRSYSVFIVNELPAETVAVLLLDCRCDEDRYIIRKKTEFLHDLSAIDS